MSYYVIPDDMEQLLGEGSPSYQTDWLLSLQYDDQQTTGPSRYRDFLTDVNSSACYTSWSGRKTSLQSISATMTLL
jgi:hypothetical protein